MADSCEEAARRSPRQDRGCTCTDRGDHHDRLLRVETDITELLELLQLAISWDEDRQGASTVPIPPQRWVAFALDHEWHDPARMRQVFGLAADIALRVTDDAVDRNVVTDAFRPKD